MASVPVGFVQTTFVFGGLPLPNGAAVTCGWSSPSMDGGEAVQVIADLIQPVQAEMSSNQCALSEVLLKYGPSDAGPTYSAPGPGLGGGGTNNPPPNTAVLIRKRVAFVSQRFSGRMYWPSPPLTAITDDGTVELEYRENMQELWDTFLTEMNTELDMTPKVFHEGSSDPRNVARFEVQVKAATQRRRLRR